MRCLPTSLTETFDLVKALPIQNTAECEIRLAICFLGPKDVKATKIHHHMSEVYGKNIMSDEMVRQWLRAFKDVWKQLDHPPGDVLIKRPHVPTFEEASGRSKRPCCSGCQII